MLRNNIFSTFNNLNDNFEDSHTTSEVLDR